MFRVRVFTPPVQNEEGLLQAGGELRLGTERVGFLVDLTHWTVADYERQWKTGTARLLHGCPSSALMTAYRGPGEATHLIWALWREGGFVYAQEHPVVVTELDPPFDPTNPYGHVGERDPHIGARPPDPRVAGRPRTGLRRRHGHPLAAGLLRPSRTRQAKGRRCEGISGLHDFYGRYKTRTCDLHDVNVAL